MSDARRFELVDLPVGAREAAVPVLIDSFVGVYRWHAKRTLRQVRWVRAARLGEEIVGVSMLEPLTPEVGYVYYLAVLAARRGERIGGLLLDDALERFHRSQIRVVYGAVEEKNAPSLGLFRSRGFRVVERRELGYAEGGLGAWGLRSRMRLVHGERLMGKRLDIEVARSE
ncbi:MAG: GNAT family N-acetyltransferase [Thermoplasmata archaeon]|nr:GNAT family N-acetyltransferase [Thermoplasmata archaeon]